MNLSVAIIDYFSNVGALASCFLRAKLSCTIIKNSKSIQNNHQKIILPGVSSFDSCIDYLQKSYFYNYLKDHNNLTDKKLLGICAGAQILFESSEEGHGTGLGLLKGKVTKIKATGNLKVPHLGWNNLILNKNHPMAYLFDGINLENKKFYFSHSYRFPDSEDTLAYVNYGEKFPVIVAKDNIIAIQFHPEKSYNQGLQLLKNICKL